MEHRSSLDERRHSISGHTVSEWIQLAANELRIDDVGLWQIVGPGRDAFGLSGDELVEFVRRGIDELLGRGAVAVDREWKAFSHSEASPFEVREAVIADWLWRGVDPEPPDSVWFVLRMA